MNFKTFLCLLRSRCLLTALILGLSWALALAQPLPPSGSVIQLTPQPEIQPPKLRTWQEIEAAAAVEAAGPLPSPRVMPFRPTMNAALYRQLKAQAARNQVVEVPAAPEIAAPAPLAATSLTSTMSFDGVNQNTAARSFIPPDTEGAVGFDHFVEVTNSHLDIYLKRASPNPPIKSVSLNDFFGYSDPAHYYFIDPRVIYDPVYNRWIIAATAYPESSAVQYFFFAVSRTSDPTATNFYIYQVNIRSKEGLNAFWDFPQLGMDQNAIIFTANLYDVTGTTGVFKGPRLFTAAKSLLYAGQPLDPQILPLPDTIGTLSPPLVLDGNPKTYLVAGDDQAINTNKIWLYTLTNSAGNPPTLSGPDLISNVPFYSFPADAPQPGPPATTKLIDTADGRFVNAGTQIGNSLFQAHSISRNSDSRTGAKCRFYEFDTENKSIVQYGDINTSGTSFDFNASIAANRRKDVFVTWSATDPTNNANAEVRVSGRLHTDPAGVIASPASVLFSSTSALTGNPVTDPTYQRWGDYSAVSLDPSDHTGATAWIVNETIVDANTWGSCIGRITLPRRFALPAIEFLLLGD